jgi:ABC-type Na+ efflux pump permease subunit
MSSHPLSNKIIIKARATRPDIASQHASPLGMGQAMALFFSLFFLFFNDDALFDMLFFKINFGFMF